MSIMIGSFTPAKGGGWNGSILTLTMRARIGLVPNDNRDNDRATCVQGFHRKITHRRCMDRAYEQ